MKKLILNPEAIPKVSEKFTRLLAEMVNSGEIDVNQLITNVQESSSKDLKAINSKL